MNGLSTLGIYLWQKRDTPEAKQLFRDSMGSVVSTAVSFGVLALVFGVLHLAGAIVSTVIANVVAVVPVVLPQSQVGVGKGRPIPPDEGDRALLAMSAIGIVVSIGGVAVARHIGEAHHLGHSEQTVLVLVANVFSFALFRFLKFMVFNRLFRVHPLEELDELVEAT